MSDFNSSLPIRTESLGDVSVRVSDSLVTSRQLTVNADGSINTVTSGTVTVSSTDLDIRDLVFATDKVDVSGSTVSLSNTDFDIRDLTHVSDSIKVGDGTDFLAVNADGSINTVILEDPGQEIIDYNVTTALAGGATNNHDWTSTGSASKLFQVLASGSGKIKIEVQIETGSGTNVFNTIFVGFNSTAMPNIDMPLSKFATVPSGAKVRVIRTNKDNQAQDVYSTIIAVKS